MRGYDTAEYASSRLVDTIIRVDGMPVMVKSVGKVGGSITVNYQSLFDGEEDLVVDLSECDLDPVPLGYVNHKKFSHYIMRQPMRKDWRQGLRMLNIVDSEGQSPRLIPYHVIAQSIMNRYPSFKNCIEALNTKSPVSLIAFHRDFAISRDALYYKGMFDIGKVDMTNGSILVNENHNWTREALDEALEKAA